MTFSKYVGIDYSGARTPNESLPGLRVFVAGPMDEPREVQPSRGPKRYVTRRGVADWLLDTLSGPERILVGIDHGFSFPKRYFERHAIGALAPRLAGRCVSRARLHSRRASGTVTLSVTAPPTRYTRSM